MSNIIYENVILENKIEDILKTNVDLNAYLTPDYSLAENAGMVKKVHSYKATGNVEDLAMGEGNTESIEVAFTEKEYRVGTTQGRFVYFDEEAMTDPVAIDAGLDGLAKQMTNDFTEKAIRAMDDASLQYTVSNWGFDDFVDAIAKFPYESEAGLFCLINPAQKAAIRKSLGEDLKYVEDFARVGYIGTVCGVPVIVSKAVPAGIAYLGTKEAVKCFIKKGVEVEQTRDANHRKNEVYARKVMLVAFVDDSKMIKMGTAQATAATITTPAATNESVAGTATAGAKVNCYVNGKYVGFANANASDGSYTIALTEALKSSDVVKVIAKIEGKLDSVAEAVVA